MKPILRVLLVTALPIATFSQSYTSYFTGNEQDKVTQPQGGICLMGGSSESDEARSYLAGRR